MVLLEAGLVSAAGYPSPLRGETIRSGTSGAGEGREGPWPPCFVWSRDGLRGPLAAAPPNSHRKKEIIRHRDRRRWRQERRGPTLMSAGKEPQRAPAPGGTRPHPHPTMLRAIVNMNNLGGDVPGPGPPRWPPAELPGSWPAPSLAGDGQSFTGSAWPLPFLRAHSDPPHPPPGLYSNLERENQLQGPETPPAPDTAQGQLHAEQEHRGPARGNGRPTRERGFLGDGVAAPGLFPGQAKVSAPPRVCRHCHNCPGASHQRSTRVWSRWGREMTPPL